MYLLDTMVISELVKRRRNAAAVTWLSRTATADLYLSAVTIGEIERGIERQKSVNPAFASKLSAWFAALVDFYTDRILPIDLPVARRWGRLSAQLGSENADLLIAATALENNLIVVTRNVPHFTPAGVSTFNPYTGEMLVMASNRS